LTPARGFGISKNIEMKITDEHYALARALRALAHPNRLAIFERIHADGLCCQNAPKGNTVCAIAEDFQLALSTVSHHLKELRDAGLITCKRHGQQVVCTINHTTLARVQALLSGTVGRRRSAAAAASRRAGTRARHI
jgi:ArsR family transcriptional regulator